MSDSQATQNLGRSLITPNDQLLRNVFNTQRSYLIDIYQREYKWTDKQVKTLLNDLEVRFELGKREKVDPKAIQKDVLQNYEPYFLNTYLTHTSLATTSIVDGQQRLTTLLLMLIKIYQILKNIESFDNYRGKTFSSDTIRTLISEKDDFGDATRFKIFNPNREAILKSLLEEKQTRAKDETQRRLRDNFDLISNYFDDFLYSDTEPCGYDIIKLTYYIAYLLDRVSIVEIRIERQDNVAMIFEVVNDRGLGLKPYEILKGKFIGNLPPLEKEEANRTWVELQNLYYQTELKNTTESRIDLDDFFRVYLRAKFADSEYDYKSYDGEYHYEIYRKPQVREHFGDFRNNEVLANRIRNEIQYFAKLYQELRADYNPTREHLFYNKLLDQNQQYLLIVSAIQLNDPEKDDKISLISAKYDQLHVILRLLGIYDSRTFQDFAYDLNKKLRGKSKRDCQKIFDTVILKALRDEKRIDESFDGSVEDVFSYERFKTIRNTSPNFSKYILMRIDRWLIELLDKPSYCKGTLQEVEERFNRTGRKRHGMHLEHIYAWNDENKALFTDPKTSIFDESGFEQTRNLFGMVLLLKDSQNLSSGNDIFRDKLDDYRMSDIIWNQILSGHIPSVDLRNLPPKFRNGAIEPDSNGVFPKNKIDQRQRLIFEAVKSIWSQV